MEREKDHNKQSNVVISQSKCKWHRWCESLACAGTALADCWHLDYQLCSRLVLVIPSACVFVNVQTPNCSKLHQV